MKLANKGHVRNGSEQDKWYGMFDILFGSVEDARRPDNPCKSYPFIAPRLLYVTNLS